MKFPVFLAAAAATLLPLCAQVQNYQPVTTEMLVNPNPNDWLMYSRTYDAQRFSPLTQINRQNVSQLGLAWSRGLPNGATETIPLVHNGVMYVVEPGAGVLALDATTGDLLWEYKRKLANPGQATSAAPRRLRFTRTLSFTPRRIAMWWVWTRGRASSAGRPKQTNAGILPERWLWTGKR